MGRRGGTRLCWLGRKGLLSGGKILVLYCTVSHDIARKNFLCLNYCCSAKSPAKIIRKHHKHRGLREGVMEARVVGETLL